MVKVYAKWIVKADRSFVDKMIKDGAFYIQCWDTKGNPNDPDNYEESEEDTVFSDDPKNDVHVRESNRGTYEVTLTGKTIGNMFSPSSLDEFGVQTYDKFGKKLNGESYDWGKVGKGMRGNPNLEKDGRSMNTYYRPRGRSRFGMRRNPRSGHTPGPWRAHDGMIYAESGNGQTIATMNSHETDADAMLIAASPDLLRALHNLALVISVDENDYPDLGAWRQTMDALDQAKAVINKSGDERIFSAGDFTRGRRR